MRQDEFYYLRTAKASDLKDKKERYLYRLFEILPGFLSWAVLFLAVFFSWQKPAWAAFFIIAFVFYWFFRTMYLSFHLNAAYKRMKKYEKIDWLKKLKELKPEDQTLKTNWQEIYHLIVLPTYKESLEILREAFISLLKSDYPKEKMIVVLACEERAGEKAKKIAQTIEKEFGKRFFRFLTTFHPADLPGEIPGHGSNETWALVKVKEMIIDPLGIPYEKIIVSSFDADTQVFPKYFSCLTWHYLTVPDPLHSSFQPIPFYFNNIWQAPLFSQVFPLSSSFWHTMNQERPEKLITFSSHAIPFKTMAEVGFKQTNVVSDDSRIFWQCFLKYDGNYKTVPLYYPVSMDANVAENLLKTAINIYKQQKRWAYGVGEIPYFLFGFLKNKKIPLKKKILLTSELMGGHLSWAVVPIIIFLLGWLPVFLGGPQFTQTLISYNLPRITSRILTISMFGLLISIYLSYLLLPPKPIKYGKWKYLIIPLGWIFFPPMMIFFSALPALEAQTRWMLGKYLDFWPTEKVRK